MQTCCSSSSDDENAPKTNDDFVDFLGNDGVRFQPSNNNAKKKNKFQQWVPEQVFLKPLSNFSVGNRGTTKKVFNLIKGVRKELTASSWCRAWRAQPLGKVAGS